MVTKRYPSVVIAVVAALALSSCGVHGLRMQTSPLLKLFAPRSGRIAYLGIDGNVRITDQSGASIQVTKDGQVGNAATTTYVAPVWSFDGSRIVFARFSQASSALPPTVDLFTANRNGRLVANRFSTSLLQPFYFYWSPDSRKITLLSQVDGTDSLELGMVSISPPRVYERLDRGSPYYWVWLPNSRSLVAHREFPTELPGGVPPGASAATGATGASGAAPPPGGASPLPLQNRVSIVSVGGAVSITDLPIDPSSFQAPEISPDGRKLVVATGRAGASELTLVDLASDARTSLAKLSGAASFSFSPDSRRIAYLEATPDASASASAKNPETSRLHVIDLSSPARTFTVKGEPVVGYYWAPNGKEIAYLTPITEKATIDPMFAQSNRLPYVQLMVADVGTHASWIVAQFPLTQGLLNNLPFNDQFQRSTTIWSPDSRSLVFTAFTSKGTPGVFTVTADGNLQPTLLAPGDFATWSWR